MTLSATANLLLLEDDAILAATLRRILSVQYRVYSAETLSQARDLIQQHTIHIALIDKSLPDGPGISLIPEIRTLSPAATMIVLTGDSDYQPVTQAIAAGADDYLVKTDQLLADLMVRIPIATANVRRRLALSGDQARAEALPVRIEQLTPEHYEKHLNSAEKKYLERTLNLCSGDLTLAAKKLGIGRSTLFAKVNELKVRRTGQFSSQEPGAHS